MNKINIFDAQKSVIDFAKSLKQQTGGSDHRGFYAGDGEQWIKCADHQAALETNQKFIFFVSGDNATVY